MAQAVRQFRAARDRSSNAAKQLARSRHRSAGCPAGHVRRVPFAEVRLAARVAEPRPQVRRLAIEHPHLTLYPRAVREQIVRAGAAT